MTINKTQQFLYFQNKAKHYDTIKNMKPAINDKLDRRYIKTLSYSQNLKQDQSSLNKNRLVPYMRQHDIKQQNQKLINRLVKMFKSQRTQISAQGNYSRYNQDDRKFRSINPYQNQLNRTIQLGNNELHQRLKNTKPRIGSSTEWSKHFGKTLSLKKNMSKYLLQSNKSKGSLHISVVDNYVPKYYQTFLNTSTVIESDKKSNKSLPKEIQITRQALLILPDIKSKQSHPSHMVRHTKDNKKLIFDRSKSSLNDNNNKSQSSLDSSKNTQNPQKSQKSIKKQVQLNQKKQKRRLLEFKFAQVYADPYRAKTRLSKKELAGKASEPQSTLKYQKSSTEQNVVQNKQQQKKKSSQQKRQTNNKQQVVNKD